MLNQTALALGTNSSSIRDLHAYGERRAALVGRDHVFDYSLGNPSIPTPPEVNDAIRELLSDTDSLEIHSYTAAEGDDTARKAISDDLNRRYGASTAPEDFFLSTGTSGELAAVMKALYVPGSEILALAPYFPEYVPFAQAAGYIFKVIPPDIPDFQIDFPMLEAHINRKTQALILNSPNNPSGVVYTRETLQKLSRLLTRKAQQYRHPIYLLSDEPYRELAYGVEVPFVPAIYPNTIICYSYSKSLSLPGERIGYVYVPREAEDSRELYAAIAGAARSLGHICAPSLWQKVIARCAGLRPDLRAYDENRTLLYEGLRSMGYETARPDGAFYLFVKAPGGDARAFSERAREKDLLVVPGDDFGCPGYFRAAYCVDPDMIRRSLPVFAALIREQEAAD